MVRAYWIIDNTPMVLELSEDGLLKAISLFGIPYMKEPM